MAYTLPQFAELEENKLRKGIIMGLLEESYILQKLPWETISAFQTQVLLWDQLPNSVGFRRLNEAFGEGTGTFRQRQEAIYDFGTDIDIDILFTKVKNVVADPRAQQVKMQLKSIAYAFNNNFINADQATEPDGFNGLAVRIDDAHARLLAQSATYPQQLSLDADTILGGGGIDMSTATGLSDHDVHKFLDAMTQLEYALDGHKADLYLTNDLMIQALDSAFRRASLYDNTKDMFGREVRTWKGVPLVDLGMTQDQVTRIIPVTSNKSPIYAVRLGVGEYLHGIQLHDLDTRELGEINDKPVNRTRMQWPHGLAQWHPRSVAELVDVQLT